MPSTHRTLRLAYELDAYVEAECKKTHQKRNAILNQLIREAVYARTNRSVKDK